ncbi:MULTISPECIES: RNA polymerase sigma factor SigC [Mycobacteroides]|uniref:RNA polymerase sigma factor n=2 Tax=Mycobacteroides TaxID=670516 RepID=A0A0E3TRX0_MYCCH|nr:MULTISPECIES: RNA polymerase sigma factor SigC [Mycobacteroides]AMW20966.1 putative RNA polymerase sigma-C factor [Mycobacterium sp. QIA-37]PKQ56824.1 RNA polymerase subunit sigma [Mycobacterium sp. MHSD3]SKN53826.1 Probable RNA polymerase sigma-C factor [Mycobacteroides abscessus subsp. bolletii]VEG18791.1 RNA polymerase sigma-C factor [Mycolicibacterium phlei]AKC39841.1 RNA polymerase sigma factor SigC [Mycobacteroides chelonae]
MATGTDDDQLLELALSAGRGDQSALESLVKATQADVWRFVAYLADTGVADDLTQETYLRALGALPRFAGRSTVRTWLLSIARRVVADHIRHLKSRPRIAHGADLEEASLRRPTHRFEELVELKALLAALDDDRREALVLTQVVGLSYAETADVCGCAIGTIRSRVARARDELIGWAEPDDMTG